MRYVPFDSLCMWYVLQCVAVCCSALQRVAVCSVSSIVGGAAR